MVAVQSKLYDVLGGECMSSRVKITADTIQLTIEEPASLSARTMQKVLRAMPKDQKRIKIEQHKDRGDTNGTPIVRRFMLQSSNLNTGG